MQTTGEKFIHPASIAEVSRCINSFEMSIYFPLSIENEQKNDFPRWKNVKGKTIEFVIAVFSSVIRANKCMSDAVGSTVKLGDHIRGEKGNER